MRNLKNNIDKRKKSGCLYYIDRLPPGLVARVITMAFTLTKPKLLQKTTRGNRCCH